MIVCIYAVFQAHQVFGQFLVLDKREDAFVRWLKSICGEEVNVDAKHCYQALSTWFTKNMANQG